MIHVHRSNRMEALAGRLAEVVASPASGPLEPETIVVQGFGMERWIAQELAKRLGVWANPAFPFPRKLLQRAFAAVLGVDPAEASPFEPESMVWSIADLLTVHLEQPEFAPIRTYLAADRRIVRRVQLAQRIATTFDQYAVYRPAMVLRWETGEGAHWQALLWRALVARHGSAHVAARAREVVAAIGRGKGPVPGISPRLHVFGVSTLPPLYLEVLGALASRIEIHLFLLSPSAGFWAHVRSQREIIRECLHRSDGAQAEIEERLHLEEGNPLLASLGRLGRDFQQILEGTIDYLDDDRDLDEPPPRTTMLATLQADVLELRHRRRGSDDAPPRPVAATDRSIAVHSCHGPMREVEVLHDQLLDLFETDPTLEPRDVVVMSPAIETYAPYVDAVFGRGHAPDSARPRIPYRIADRGPRATAQAVDAFDKILEALRGRMTAPEVLDLLALDAVRARFGIEAEDLDRCRRWVRESNVRWAADAEHRSDFGQPSFRENTWRFGFDRLLLGYAMPGGERTLYRGVLPYDDVEGGEADLLGRLVDFCETLFHFRTLARETRPLVEWRDLLSSLLERMVAVDPANVHQHREIRSALADVAERAERAGFAEPVDLETVQSRVDLDLGTRTSTYGFLGGGVTFCALVPMRSIPFRVVCLLGMSDGAYPRVRRRLGFDLIAERPRAGDRSQRDDDRYLFLEALLSARDRLLVTYVGQGIQDPREIPPSVVVSELLDALDESFTAEGHGRIRDRVVVRHPLQPFSPRYFGDDADERLFSYSAAYLGGAEAVGRKRKPVPPFLARPLPADPEPPRAISIDELTRFFRNPSKAFLERRLALRLGDDLDVLEDREPLELDALARWRVGDDLLKRFLAGDDLEHAFAPVRASGAIPAGTVGECLYEDLRAEVEDIGREARRRRGDTEPRRVPIDATIAGVRITGALEEVWPRGQIRCQYSRLGRASEIDLWIRHLLLCLSSPEGCEARTLAAGRVEKGSGLLVVGFARVTDARDILEELVRSYVRGLSTPIPFFPRTARVYCTSLGKGEQVALAEARKVFEAGDYNPAAEADDPYVARLYEGRDPLDPHFRLFGRESDEPLSFHRIARAVLSPLLACRTTE